MNPEDWPTDLSRGTTAPMGSEASEVYPGVVPLSAQNALR